MSDYHEPQAEMEEADRNIARALISLKEEIEAVNWYHQRAVATRDDSLRAILIHNRDEEIEHAAMALEWLRRTVPAFDEVLREVLFKEGPIGQGHESDTSETEGGDLGIGRSTNTQE